MIPKLSYLLERQLPWPCDGVVGTLLLGLVVGMGLFVVLAAFATEKEQNLLSVATSHTATLQLWRIFGKRAALYVYG